MAVEWEAADVVAAPAMFVFGMAGWIVCLTVFATAVAHLALTFPSPPALLQRRPSLVGVLYGVALAVNVGVVVYLLVGRATIAGLQRWYDVSSMVLTAMGLLAITANRAYRLARLARQVGPATGASCWLGAGSHRDRAHDHQHVLGRPTDTWVGGDPDLPAGARSCGDGDLAG